MRRLEKYQSFPGLIFLSLQYYSIKGQKMPKLNWNDINDSDSSLESEPQAIQAKKSELVQNKNAAKVPNSSLKAACDQYSLQRLQKHIFPTIWLYITNSYNEKSDDIHDLLLDSSLFTQVIRLKNVGWNVETSFQKGKQLIYEGLKQDNLSVKFIYSKRNQEKSLREENKMQKKVTYVQKGKEPILHKYQTFTEEVHKYNGAIDEQDLVSPKTKAQKQKSKWIEKGNSKYGNNESKGFESPRTFNQLRQFKSPKRYVQKVVSTNDEPQNAVKKEAEEPIELEQKKEPQKVQIPSKSQNLQKDERSQNNCDNNSQKETSLQKRECNKPQEEQESEQSQKEQKKKKQKKKRQGKAKKQQKPQKKDSNPFSYFSRF